MHKIIDSLGFGIIAVVFLVAGPILALAQEPPALPAPVPSHRPGPMPPAIAPMMGGDSSEKSLKVDSNVNIGLCVTQGTVSVNSWKRDELRVFVHDGSKFGFKVTQKSEKTGDPVWVMVMGVDARKKNSVPTECISGGEIEIDAPANAMVKIKGEDVNTSIDGVRKVYVQVSGGSISIRNIAQGIVAKTYQGGINVEESKGPMELETTNGNLVAFEVGPSDIGDTFAARTNGGTISLQKVEHRQLDVSSILGSLVYNGPILNGSTYNLSTTNGSIRLALPLTTACKLSATYGNGSFESELPFKLATENVMGGPIKTVVGTLGGGGDAVIKLTVSNNGSIAIKKL